LVPALYEIQTSNATSVTKVRSASAGVAGMWRPWWVSLQDSYVAKIIFHRLVWYRALSLCVYSKFGHHPHPCQICFFCGLRCCASPWRKIAYSITQSLTQLIWSMPREPKRLCFGMSY